jgi:hypothetical protein
MSVGQRVQQLPSVTSIGTLFWHLAAGSPLAEHGGVQAVYGAEVKTMPSLEPHPTTLIPHPSRLRKFAVGLLTIMVTTPVGAQDWSLLRDQEFGYQVPIPPSYDLTLRPDAGNSRLYHNSRGDLLAVWAGSSATGSFSANVADRRRQDEEAGWDISYEWITQDWASYSGSRDGQIRYVRAIRFCGDRTAFFLIDYQQSEKTRYDPIVTRMVRQMRSSGRC